MKRIYLNCKILLCLALGCLATPIPVSAQIIPDATLPQNSTVNVEAEINRIVGGTRAGGNLFHSFQEFSVPEGITAYFDNPFDLQNIIARVTGGNISNIEGILRANGSANLFLINPGGIAFGPNATLDIGGSFAASSADSVVFDNGFEFSATNPIASPLLAVNIPIGLRFRENPGAIQVAGLGNNLRFDADFLEIVVEDRPPGLAVSRGKTLALLGGDVTLSGGNLTAEEGRIEIWSGGEGFLALSDRGQNIAIAEDGAPTEMATEMARELGTVRFERAASVDVSGSGSGDVKIVGKSVIFNNASTILAITRGSNDGGNVTVQARESVAVSSLPPNNFQSGIFSETGLESTGNGGSVRIETGRFTISHGGLISTSILGNGNAGNIEISSEQLNLRDGAFILSDTFGNGDAGNITISASDRLTLSNGPQINVTARSAGNGGSLTVRAQTVELIGGRERGRSGLFASAIDEFEDGRGTGAGGDITVIGDRLIVRDGAIITASNFQSRNRVPPGRGPAGSIRIQAREILLDNEGIISAAAAVGDRGNVFLNANDIKLRRGSMVTASAQGSATGGNITISTDNLAALENSDISANAEQSTGGNIAIQAQGIFGTEFRNSPTPQSDITATSELGAAFSGTVELNVADADPGAAIAIFPQTVVDVGRLIDETFCAQARKSSFTVGGRGGLPPNPTEVLDFESVSIDLIEPSQERSEANLSSQSSMPESSLPESSLPARKVPERELPSMTTSVRSSQIVPAQGLIVNQNGQVELVGYATAASESRPWRGLPRCERS